jgi:general secretion pathway protein D
MNLHALFRAILTLSASSCLLLLFLHPVTAAVDRGEEDIANLLVKGERGGDIDQEGDVIDEEGDEFFEVIEGIEFPEEEGEFFPQGREQRVTPSRQRPSTRRQLEGTESQERRLFEELDESPRRGQVEEGEEERAKRPTKETRKIDAEGAKDIALNFDDTDIITFLQTVSEITGMNFIIAPGVSGTVTIQTSRNFLKENLPEILDSVLEVYGFTAVPSGDYYKILPSEIGKQFNLETNFGNNLNTIYEKDRYITQIVPLEYISCLDLEGILRSLMSPEGDIIPHEGTNILIIYSSSSNIKKLMKIIESLDIPSYKSDQELYVYYLENANAANVADVLNRLYAERYSSTYRRPTTRSRTSRSSRSSRTSSSSAETRGRSSTSSPFTEGSEETMLVPDEDINALIIRTSPRNFRLIEETIRKLDIKPRQVLIQMLIAEITLDDTNQFGIEWEIKDWFEQSYKGNIHQLKQSGSNKIGIGGDDALSAGFVHSSDTGFNYMITETNHFIAIINAKAKESKLDVLASPHVLATDNKEASISITTEVPIESRQVGGTEATTGYGTYYSYQYKDAGIKMTMTPHINNKGLVALDIEEEVSEISGEAGGTAGTAPIFRKRNIITSIVIPDGQTVAIGGLMEEKEDITSSGIPLLSKIPLLGYLFKYTSKKISKTEMVVFLTPRVISNPDDSEKISKDYRKTIDELKILGEQSVGKRKKDTDEGESNNESKKIRIEIDDEFTDDSDIPSSLPDSGE